MGRAQAADREKSEKLWEAKLATALSFALLGAFGRRFDALVSLAEAAELSRQLGHPPELLANSAMRRSPPSR